MAQLVTWLSCGGLGHQVRAQDPAEVEADDHHEHNEQAVEQKPVTHFGLKLSSSR